MKKVAAFIFAFQVCFLLAACGRNPGTPAAGKPGPTTRELLERSMPLQMADGIVKVAIVRNLSVGDHTRQFLEGCMAEGRAMGFTIDTFITNGDNDRCRELIGQITLADYDGLILSNGDADFTYDTLKPVVDRGIKVVTFDALPFKEGNPAMEILPGVTSTFQDDINLAKMSLDSLLSSFDPSQRPIRVIRAWFGPGIPPLDRRQTIYNEYIQNGSIVEAALISPKDFAFSRNGSRDALDAILPQFPPGTVDAIWASYDDFAKGCVDTLEDAHRDDIKMMSIDISNDDIKLMLEHSAFWLGTVAVDPRFIGIVNMRILAAKFAGEPTQETFTFDAHIIQTSALNKRINMANISEVAPNWKKDQDIFSSYPWMGELKTAKSKQLRLASQTSRGAR